MTDLTRKQFIRLGGATALLAVTGLSPARADQFETIKGAGKIRIGTDTAYPPYGMLDGTMKPTGSDVEVALALGKDFGLEVEFIPTVNATRIPNLQTDRADIIISVLSITPERAKVIDFSRPYSAIRAVVGGLKDVPVAGMNDLKGKTVAVTRASVTDKTMTDASSEYELTIQRYEDDATLMTAAVSGQAQIVASSGNIINEIVRRNDKFEPKFEQASYDLAIGLKKGEPALKEKLDAWVLENLKNGRLNEIYKKYHLVDLPERIASQS